MNLRKVRDLSLIDLDNKTTLVIACDSCGAIGMKEGDSLKVPPFYVGKFTARVALFEVLCTGAQVVAITNNVCNEMEPTGIQVIKGIREELADAGIEEAMLTGSTEENFKTISTAVGITVIGTIAHNSLKVNAVLNEAVIVSIGLPKVGDQINYVKDEEIVSYFQIKSLLKLKEVYEIVPVGSRGIAYECDQMAAYNNLKMCFEEKRNIDVFKSSGPATCVIAAVKPDFVSQICSIISNVNVIGRLENNA
jgi:hypothetical protein